ncbi:MAG: sigma 54-interacting transcriptional regulator [Deltaproteobacteria bacterium]|nr:sigma 54-interacting transcriptional regulator [Deltaproteobacteria bacterium]
MFEKELNIYWKTVVDTIQDGVMIVNTEGRIVSVNSAFEAITGYGQEEVIGQLCSLLDCSACEQIREGGNCHWCVMFERGKLKKQKCTMKRKDGRFVNIVKNASILEDGEGNVTGAVETLTDITDLIDKEIQIERYKRVLKEEDRFCGMIGASASMQQVFDLVSNASMSEAPTIIYGESGTGKELVAKAIHEIGVRKDKPFIKVNCAALNEALLESELFGHVKGAFTGAYKTREGRFEAAGGGDIFLDEIGDLPLSTQVKLLRVLEEKVVERVGDNRPIHTDVRIISATNQDLKQLVKQGSFREDFYYRINVIPIYVPPLRDRIGDVPILAASFFRRLKVKSGKDIKELSPEALSLLIQYSWPGNVRELKSAFEYAFVSCNGDVILPQHLPIELTKGQPGNETERVSSESLEKIKKQRLMDALRKSGGNQSKAARILGISRTSVWNQIKKFNIKV